MEERNTQRDAPALRAFFLPYLTFIVGSGGYVSGEIPSDVWVKCTHTYDSESGAAPGIGTGADDACSTVIGTGADEPHIVEG